MLLLALAFLPASATALSGISVQQSNDIVNSQGYLSVSFTIGVTHFLTAFSIQLPLNYVTSTSAVKILAPIGVPTGMYSVSCTSSSPPETCTLTYTFTNNQNIPAGRVMSLALAGIQFPGLVTRSDASEPQYVTITTYYKTTVIETGTNLANPFYLRQITGADIATSSNLMISSASLNCDWPTFASGNSTCFQVTGSSHFIGQTTTQNVLPDVNNAYNLGSPSDKWANLFVNAIDVANLALSGSPDATITASTAGANLVLETSSAGTGSVIISPSGNAQLTVSGSSPQVSVANNLQVGGTATVTGVLNANGGITVANSESLAFGTGASITFGDDNAIIGSATNYVNTLYVDKIQFESTGLFGTYEIAGSPTLAVDLAVNSGVNVGTIGAALGTLFTAGVTSPTGTDLTLTGSSGNVVTGSLLQPNGGINVNSGKFTVDSATGNTAIAGTLGVTGVSTFASTINANGGITTDCAIACDLNLNSGTGNIRIASGDIITGNYYIGGTPTLATNIAVGTDNLYYIGGSGTALNHVYANNVVSSTGHLLNLWAASGEDVFLGPNGGSAFLEVSNPSSNIQLASTGDLILTSTATNGNVIVTPTGTGTFEVTSGEFTVDGFGNTAIGGTLSVANTATLSSALYVSGMSYLNGGITVLLNKFTVDTSGNTAIAGTLGVTGATSLGSTLAVTGATTLTGLLTANGGITSNGAVSITGSNTLTVGTGATTLGGSLTVAGLSSLNGGINVNSGKFTVDATTGNTLVGGTLAVTGASTLTGLLTTNGGITNNAQLVESTTVTSASTVTLTSTSNEVQEINSQPSTVNLPNPTLTNGLTFTIIDTSSTNDLTIATPIAGYIVSVGAKATSFTLAHQSLGSTSVTLVSDGSNWQLTVNAPGAGAVTSVVNSDGSLTVSQVGGVVTVSLNTAHSNTWSAAQTFNALVTTTGGITDTGAVSISGDTTVTGTYTFTVNSGATTLGGTLSVTGTSTLGGVSDTGTLGVSGATTLSNTLSVSGATTLSNTLSVSGATTLSNSLSVTGTATLNSGLSVAGSSTLAGVTATSITVSGSPGSLTVSGATSLAGLTASSITDSGGLTVTGSTSLGGLTASSVTDTGAALVSGLLTANGGIALTGTLSGSYTIGGSPSLGSTLGAGGAGSYNIGTGNTNYLGTVYANVLQGEGSTPTLNGFTISGSTITWSELTSFPSACSSGAYVTQISTTPTCTAPTPGTGISISGYTISNTGVLAVSGTTNQITANTVSGLVTLSLPSTVDLTTGGTLQFGSGNTITYSSGAITLGSGLGLGDNGFTVSSTGAITGLTGVSGVTGTVTLSGASSVSLPSGKTTGAEVATSGAWSTGASITTASVTTTASTKFYVTVTFTGDDATATSFTLTLSTSGFTTATVSSPTAFTWSGVSTTAQTYTAVFVVTGVTGTGSFTATLTSGGTPSITAGTIVAIGNT